MIASTTRIFRPALLVVLFLGMAALPAQAQFGVSAGANFSSIDDIRAAGQNGGTLESATGFHVGVVYDIGLGPVNFRPGLHYRRAGTYQFPDAGEFTVSAFEAPLDMRVTVFPFPLISGYLLGGPKFFLPRSDGDLDDDLESISYTIDVGVGASISVPGLGWTLQPELRYEFGASNYIDENIEIGDTTFQADERKLSAFALRLNVLF